MSNGENTPVTPLTYKQCIDKYGAGAARCQSLKKGSTKKNWNKPPKVKPLKGMPYPTNLLKERISRER